MIYAYTAGKTKLTNTLWNLKNVDMCYVVYPNNIEHYLQILYHKKPTLVLGMGVYSGRDQDKIRIETICTNKFRNDFFDKDELIEINIPNLSLDKCNFR